MPTLATPAGTRRYADRMKEVCAAGHFRPWPQGPEAGEPLFLSSLGLGSYTGEPDDATDRSYAAAVQESVRQGVNVIDCSINYRHMRSERALGRGLRELFAAGRASRDEVLVMTKGGYLPFDGALPSDPGGYFRRTYVDGGLVRPEELVAGCHCIAPRFLGDQLTRSLANFGLDGVDVYSLHNAEQQLDEVPEDRFYLRVREAFTLLEKEVGGGRVGLYGVATWNGFRVPPGQPGHLSLERLMETAQEVAGAGHHFRVLQLPYNLGMLEALSTPTQVVQGQSVPFLNAAQAYGMLVVTSVPLLQTQVLPHVPPGFADRMPGLSTAAQRALQFVRSSPGVLAPLVGMKSLDHVRENTALARTTPLTQEAFYRLFEA